MTREQIEAMTGGEVDQYIATKIFGFKWSSWNKYPAASYDEDHGHWDNDRGAEKYVRIHDSHSWEPHRCQDDAMEAAKKVGLELNIQEKGWSDSWTGTFALLFTGETWEAGWLLSSHNGDELYGPWTGSSPDPAMAICRALIAAHEAKGK